MWDENVAGMAQPFGCTGDQSDRTAGTYFAQAGEYKAEIGWFMAEDIHWNADNRIYGDRVGVSNEPVISAMRQSSNIYEYCMSNPIYWPAWSRCRGYF